MRTTFKALALATALVAAPAMAQVAAGQSTAVLDVDGAISNSAAFKAATQQIQTTYRTQITAYETRAKALDAELQPLQREIQTLQQTQGTAPATLEGKVNAYRTRGQAAQAELARLATPFARPTAFAREQVEDKVEDAIKAAMTAKRVNLVVRPETIIAVNPAANLTGDVIGQLDILVKTVSITPPANWQPGQQRAGAPAATAPARPANPQGR